MLMGNGLLVAHSVFVGVVPLVTVFIIVDIELLVVRRIVAESAVCSIHIVILVVKVEIFVGIVIRRVILSCSVN